MTKDTTLSFMTDETFLSYAPRMCRVIGADRLDDVRIFVMTRPASQCPRRCRIGVFIMVTIGTAKPGTGFIGMVSVGKKHRPACRRQQYPRRILFGARGVDGIIANRGKQTEKKNRSGDDKPPAVHDGPAGHSGMRYH